MKKTAKKLTLEAQTVRVLNPADLQNVVGGVTITTGMTCTCPHTNYTAIPNTEVVRTLRCTK